VFEVTKRKAHWKDSWVYYIARQKDVLFFVKKIGDHIITKKYLIRKKLPHLEFMVKNIERKKNNQLVLKDKAIKLRKSGLTYRQIGHKLNKDFGYIRRLILK
jgi:hypothetical protein